MLWIHVALNLKYESGEDGGLRVDGSTLIAAGGGRRGQFHQRFQECLHSEIVQSAAEEYGGLAAIQESFPVKLGSGSFQQRQRFPKLKGVFLANHFLQRVIVQRRCPGFRLQLSAHGGTKLQQTSGCQIHYTAKLIA